jgi:hypothetical protein
MLLVLVLAHERRELLYWYRLSRVDLYSLGIFELCPGSLTFFGV